MTDNRKTDPAPAPKSTVPPHVDCARLGMAIVGFEDIARYLGSKLDGDLAEFANEVVTKVYEKQAAFEERVLRSQARVEANQELLLEHFRSLTDRVNLLEGQHAANHPVRLSLAPDEAKAE